MCTMKITEYFLHPTFAKVRGMTVSESDKGDNEDSKRKDQGGEETNPGKDFMEAKNITEDDNMKKSINEVSSSMANHSTHASSACFFFLQHSITVT